MNLCALVCFDSEAGQLSVMKVSEIKLEDFTISPGEETWECRDYMGKIKKNKVGVDFMFGPTVSQYSDIIFVFNIEIASHVLMALEVTSKFAFQLGMDSVE